MAVYKKKGRAYGLTSPLVNVTPEPIISSRTPTSRDRAELGTLWIYQDPSGTDNVYTITSVTANSSAWSSLGGGSGQFDAVTVNPGDLTVTVGDATVSIGDFTVSAGTVTLGSLGLGVVQSSSAGVLTSSNGTDGQLLIASTGLAPSWSTLTAGGGISITEAAGTITITDLGATGTTFGTDAGGPVSPTVGGLTTFEGYDTNITTDGATANTVKIRLADDIISVGSLTAGVDLNMASGECTIIADANSADSIYLRANGGTAESIRIHSDQGTAVDSILIESDVGGLSFTSGLASADAINISATNAAGGIDVDFGTTGMAVTGVNGSFVVSTGTGAITIGLDAAAKDVSVGNATGASSLTLAAGTGNYISTSTGTMLFDCVGVLELNSSAGIIGIGDDAVSQNINIGTGAADRVITIGNTTGASQVVLNCGTAGVSIGTSATAHTSTFGGTNTTSATTVQAGTGAMTFTAGGIFDVNAVDEVTIDSTGGAISIGSGNNANNIAIGTGTAARLITVGNATGATSIVLNSGTGAVEVGSNAVAHQVRVGSTTGAANTTIQCGTGAMIINGGGVLNVDAAGDITVDSSGGILDMSVTGAVTIDSSGSTIGIGVDDIDQNIDIGTAGERIITVGNQVGAAGAIIEGGTTNGIELNASGLISVEVAVDTQAASTVTINSNAGYGTFTGLTTAAAATQVLTVTNSLCATDSALLVTVGDNSANDSKMTIERVTPLAGSFTVSLKNGGTQAVNGNLTVTFWILAA